MYIYVHIYNYETRTVINTVLLAKIIVTFEFE